MAAEAARESKMQNRYESRTKSANSSKTRAWLPVRMRTLSANERKRRSPNCNPTSLTKKGIAVRAAVMVIARALLDDSLEI